MKYSKMNRRMFLQGASGALLPIPFLGSLFPINAMANGEPIKRFISILTPYDYGHHVNWFPHAGGPINDIKQPLQTLTPGGGLSPVKYQRLRDFAPSNSVGISTVLGPWLTPYLGSINIMRSLDFLDARGHNSAKLLGGIISSSNDPAPLSPTPTIDHVLANNARFNPKGSPLTLMGYTGSFGGSGFSYSADSDGTVRRATGIGNRAEDIYNFIFNNGNAPESGGTQVNPRLDQLTNVIEDYRRIKNHRRISSVDKNRLEQVMDIFSDIQRAGSQGATAQCQHKNLPTTYSSRWRSNTSHRPSDGKMFADLITAALLCDLTRVVTVGGSLPNREIVDGANSWLGHGNQSQGLHGTHGTFSVLNGKANWEVTGSAMSMLSKNFLAPLLSNLEGVIEPSNGKSMLHNSLVLYAMESSTTHHGNSTPCLLAGNAAGSLTSGHYIDYADRSKGTYRNRDASDPEFLGHWYGVHYNRMLVTVLQAMGCMNPPQESRIIFDRISK